MITEQDNLVWQGMYLLVKDIVGRGSADIKNTPELEERNNVKGSEQGLFIG